MDLSTPKVLLLLLSAWGFWTLWGFPYTNGLLRILKNLSDPGASIPGPTWAPMRQRYTGIKLIDTQLTTLTGFFYTAIDGNRADVSLIGLDLGGSVVGAWMLITVESLRAGNRGETPIVWITLLGILLQNIGFACVAPIWLAIHLSISPTVTNPKDFQLMSEQPLQLAIAPLSVMAGYGGPSVMMCLPAPHLISFEAKQAWAALQQLWPVWIAITQIILTIVISAVNSTTGVASEAEKKFKTAKYLRRIYVLAILSAVVGQWIPYMLSGFAYAFPVLFSDKYLPMLQPRNVFVPPVPFGARQAATLADGALWFLQWDYYTGSSAVLVWSITLRLAAKRETATSLQILSSSIKTALIVFLLGPVGAAVVSVWSRDELVFKGNAGDSQQKRQ